MSETPTERVDLIAQAYAENPDGISCREEKALKAKQKQLDAALWGKLGDRKAPVGKLAARIERALVDEYHPATLGARLLIRQVAGIVAIAERRRQLSRLDTDDERGSVEKALRQAKQQLDSLDRLKAPVRTPSIAELVGKNGGGR